MISKKWVRFYTQIEIIFGSAAVCLMAPAVVLVGITPLRRAEMTISRGGPRAAVIGTAGI